MRYAHKEYTQGTVAFINHETGYEPGQIDDFILSIEIVDVDDPSTLTYTKDGDVSGGYNEYITNSSININVFSFKSVPRDQRVHFNLDLFTDALPFLTHVMPVFEAIEDDTTIDDLIRILEANGFKASGYHTRAQGTKWRERQAS